MPTFLTHPNHSAKKTLQIVRQQKLKSVLVISQYYHIPRARMALTRFGISEIYSSHARFFETRDVYSVPRELLGYIRYIFRHYDDTDKCGRTSGG